MDNLITVIVIYDFKIVELNFFAIKMELETEEFDWNGKTG